MIKTLPGLASVFVALGVGTGACSSSEPPPCLASGTYTLKLATMDDASVMCGGYGGSVATVSLSGLHYSISGSTGSATIEIARSPGTQLPETWSQCQITDYSGCQQLTVVCTNGANEFVVFLSTEGSGLGGFALYQVDGGSQCYENYEFQNVTGPH